MGFSRVEKRGEGVEDERWDGRVAWDGDGGIGVEFGRVDEARGVDTGKHE